MKILLIDPPFGFQEIGGNKSRFATVNNIIPSLGLGYLAAIARKHGHDVKIIDGAITPDWNFISNQAQRFTPDIIGITATTPTFKNAQKAAQILKKVLPSAIFVLGGAHPTAALDHAAQAKEFDYFIIGEGELTFVELLEYISGKSSFNKHKINGLAFWDKEKLTITPSRERIKNLDSLPFPARDLFPSITKYSPTPASYRRLPLAHIMTSRGCPLKCAFCDRSIFQETLKQRSAQNVLKEVDELITRYGVREIRFFDDCFTINRGRLEEICQGMKKLKPCTPWTCLTSVNFIDQDMLNMMHDAGCWQILYGLESGSDDILRTIGKQTTVKKNKDAVELAHKAGMRVRADFIVGTPSETMKTLRDTMKFAKSLAIDFAHFNKFVPFPGTGFYKQLKDRGYEFDFSLNWSTLNHDSLIFVPEAIEKQEYQKFLDNSYKEFYFRPGYILRRLLAIRTFTELFGNFKGLFSIFSI